MEQNISKKPKQNTPNNNKKLQNTTKEKAPNLEISVLY